MTEAALTTQTRQLLKGPNCYTLRLETTTEAGVPDLYYNVYGSTGWLELKWKRVWPTRATTTVKLPHYTDQQRRFLAREGRCGGRAWLLLQVEEEHLLFDWRAAQAVGYLTKAELYKVARCVWEGPLTRSPLVWALRGLSNRGLK
jgi:hypothetical protein